MSGTYRKTRFRHGGGSNYGEGNYGITDTLPTPYPQSQYFISKYGLLANINETKHKSNNIFTNKRRHLITHSHYRMSVVNRVSTFGHLCCPPFLHLLPGQWHMLITLTFPKRKITVHVVSG